MVNERKILFKYLMYNTGFNFYVIRNLTEYIGLDKSFISILTKRFLSTADTKRSRS